MRGWWFAGWIAEHVAHQLPAQLAEFVEQATAAGLTNLAGHRSVGGMRASIYNAMPLEGVEALIDFMTDFQTRNS